MYHDDEDAGQSLMQSAELNSLLDGLDLHWEKMDAALSEGDGEEADALLDEIRRLSRQIEGVRIRNQLLCRMSARAA